jgi:hypothetical protein
MRLDHRPGNRQSLRFPQVFSELPKVELAIVRGRVRNRIRPVVGPVFLIGGASQCDLVLGDPQVPAVHSYLLVTRRGVLLRHLGAPPFVLVEGRQIDSVRLADGQQISLAPFQFQVHIDHGPQNQAGACPHHGHAFASRPHHLSLHRGDSDDALEHHRATQRGWN